MSESTSSSEPVTGPVTAATLPAEPPPPVAVAPVSYQRPNRLNQVAAWVGIVAGIVFIVAVIFGTGFVLGKSVGHGGFDRGPGHGMSRHDGPPPMFMVPRGPGGPGGPGFGGPGFGGPGGGGPGFGGQSPQQSPGGQGGNTAPATPRP